MSYDAESPNSNAVQAVTVPPAGAEPDWPPYDPTAEPPDDPYQNTADNEPTFTFIDGATFILDQPAKIPTLWGNDTDVLWSQDESLMIAGPMGLGKTTLAVMLMCAQLGINDSSVLGMPVSGRSKILYLAMDRPAQIARAMLRRFSEDDRAVLARTTTHLARATQRHRTQPDTARTHR